MSKVLVLSPHPDDEAIGCGGSLCSHSKCGDSVEIIFLTSGEKGGHGLEERNIAALREREAARAASILQVRDIEFWRQPDGALRSTARLVERLSGRLRALMPGLIYAPHPGEMHPDHRATSRLLRGALKQTLRAKFTPEIRLYEVWTPIQEIEYVEDISPHIDRKLDAIRAYETQCSVMKFDAAAEGLARYRGEMHSWPGGDYAEVFTKAPY